MKDKELYRSKGNTEVRKDTNEDLKGNEAKLINGSNEQPEIRKTVKSIEMKKQCKRTRFTAREQFLLLP